MQRWMQVSKAHVPQSSMSLCLSVWVSPGELPEPQPLHLHHSTGCLLGHPWVLLCACRLGPGSEPCFPALMGSFEPLGLHMCLELSLMEQYWFSFLYLRQYKLLLLADSPSISNVETLVHDPATLITVLRSSSVTY